MYNFVKKGDMGTTVANLASRIANGIDYPKSLSRVKRLNDIIVGPGKHTTNWQNMWYTYHRDTDNIPAVALAGTGVGGLGGFLNYKRKRKNFKDKINSILSDTSLSQSDKFNKLKSMKAPSLLLNTATGAGLGFALGGFTPIMSYGVEKKLALNKILRANNIKPTSNWEYDIDKVSNLYTKKIDTLEHNSASLLQRIQDWMNYGTPILKQEDNIKWFNPYTVK